VTLRVVRDWRNCDVSRERTSWLQYAIARYRHRQSITTLPTISPVSTRPDFAVALYPGHLWIDEDKLELNPEVRVTKQVPPQFLLQAEMDDVDDVNHSLVYYLTRACCPS
jgi:hypothetical protein